MNLVRLYNQNRKGIWRIIIIIAFLILVLQLVNYWVKKGEEKQRNNLVNTNIVTDGRNTIQITTDKSTVTGKSISQNKLESEINTITTFLESCNNGQIETAYDMLTDECKDEMYNSLEDFKDFYYTSVFQGSRISFEIENWIDKTYKIKIVPDMLATGKSNDGKNKQDYITVEEVNGENKLNINSYVKRRKIDSVKESDNIKLTVNYVDVYMDYEKYNITINNKCGKSILLDDLESIDSMYIEDKNKVKYNAYTHEIGSENLEIARMQTKEIELKYYSKYISSKEMKKIVFSKVILDNEEYRNQRKSDIEEIKIDL